MEIIAILAIVGYIGRKVSELNSRQVDVRSDNFIHRKDGTVEFVVRCDAGKETADLNSYDVLIG